MFTGFHSFITLGKQVQDYNCKLFTLHVCGFCVPEPDAEVFPQPWLLYVALLLVHLIVLLVVLTALLYKRSDFRKLGRC